MAALDRRRHKVFATYFDINWSQSAHALPALLRRERRRDYLSRKLSCLYQSNGESKSAALHYLLGYPLCRRKWCYRNVQDFPVHVPDYKKDMERLK